MSRFIPLTLLLALIVGSFSSAIAADPKASPPEDDQAKLFKAFEETLKNVQLTGSFTITGQDNKGLRPETYEISSVSKLGEGDLWVFNARIKYGDKDMKLPLPLEVKWAGNTPVITLDKTTIPGLGTFSAHVVIDGDKYAGTWTHGPMGGCLFGDIKKVESPEEASSK